MAMFHLQIGATGGWCFLLFELIESHTRCRF